MKTTKAKEFYETNITWIVIVLTIIIVLGFCIFMEHYYFEYFIHPNNPQWDVANNIHKIYSACLIILTFILVCVAWIQLTGIKRISKADFLLRLDERYSSLEIIKARAIIHRLHCLVKTPEISDETRIQRIAEEIKNIGQNHMDSLEFTYLLNFLDFLETLAYFCNRGYISVDDVDDLIGNSMVFYYKVFKKWIYYRKEKYNNDFYCELKKVIKKIEKKNCCKKQS